MPDAGMDGLGVWAAQGEAAMRPITQRAISRYVTLFGPQCATPGGQKQKGPEKRLLCQSLPPSEVQKLEKEWPQTSGLKCHGDAVSVWSTMAWRITQRYGTSGPTVEGMMEWLRLATSP